MLQYFLRRSIANSKMSIFLLFMFLCVPYASTLRNYGDFFNYIGLNTQCAGNTTYDYTTDCSIRCDNLDSTPKECTRLPYYGCTCKEGYIPLDTYHKPLACLKVEDCPKNLTNTDCSGDTVFGSIPYFTKVCDSSNYHYMVNRSRYFGCICEKGFIPLRYPFPPTCVKEEDCPRDPTVVYTGLQPSDPSDTPQTNGSLNKLKQKYGLKGPYSSEVTATTMTPASDLTENAPTIPPISPATTVNQKATTNAVNSTS